MGIRVGTLVLVAVAIASPLFAADDQPVSTAEVSKAVERGLPLVIAAAGRYPSHRDCFSCHHQTFPMLAVREASAAGIVENTSLIEEQWKFTRASLEDHLAKHRDGKRIPGRAATVTFGVWAAWLADNPDADREMISQMQTYLAENQHGEGWWQPPSDRPPSGSNRLRLTVLAASLLPEGVTCQKAESWIRKQTPSDVLEAAAMLSFAVRIKDTEKANEMSKRISELQNEDGGWSGRDREESDVYTTARVLYDLLDSNRDAVKQSIPKAVQYLLTEQKPDGSWHVKKWARAVQSYFDNGDPYQRDQFISTSASCWAIATLSKWSRLTQKSSNPTTSPAEAASKADTPPAPRK